MYEKAESAIDRILELVAKCPKELQAGCFSVLLEGYVRSELGETTPSVLPPAAAAAPVPPPPGHPESQIPATVLPRFKTMAKRLEVAVSALEALFDFNTDPFTLHAVSIPGTNNAEKTRNVALLLAAKSYLTTGTWSADWQELKAQCVDQNCYDTINHSSTLKKGAPKLFKPVEAGKAIELSTGGIQEAEKLLKKLSAGQPE